MALEPLSRDRLIRGGALAIRGLLHEEDPVEISRVGAVPGHRFPQPDSATARGVERSRLFANLALLLVFACLAGLLAHFSGGRSDAPGKLPSGFRSSTGGVERFRNGPVGPEQDVMRFDAPSAAVIVVSGLVSGSLAQTPVEWKVSAGGNGHWYGTSIELESWSATQQFAQNFGGSLACIGSPDENQFALSILPAGLGTGFNWIGLRRVGGEWSWVSGEPANWFAWHPFEPNGSGDQYAWMYSCCGFRAVLPESVGLWNDTPTWASDRHTGIIEWSADCNADGKVDYGQIRRGELADFNGNNIPDCCERGEPCVVDNFPVEWKKSEGGNGHWYRGRPSSSDRSADSWRIEAQGRGAHLVTIVTQQESDWLDVLVDQDSLWPSSYVGPIIGMRVDDGGCAAGCWDTGEPLSWTNWWPGNPDVTDTDRSVCLFDRSSRKWQNYPEGGGDFGNLAKPRSTIFEWSADCNADGKVDLGQILGGDLLDRDQNGVLDECQCGTDPSLAICCTSDLDLDGEIGASDISLLLLTFGEPRWAAPAFDLDGDGEIGGGDISIILLDVGPCS